MGRRNTTLDGATAARLRTLLRPLTRLQRRELARRWGIGTETTLADAAREGYINTSTAARIAKGLEESADG